MTPSRWPALFVLLSGFVAGQAPASRDIDPQVDRIIAREQELVKSLDQFTPVVETYIQEFAPDAVTGSALSTDHYFLGKVAIGQGFRFVPLMPQAAVRAFARGLQMQPAGFAQTLTPDPVAWNRDTYVFEHIRTEFLGEVRCLVYDVMPRDRQAGRFTGRIWVEDRDLTIVRFNGTYSSTAGGWGYSHFDSWRMRTGEGLWVPVCMYLEESDLRRARRSGLSFRGQTRFWGYLVSRGAKQAEMASVQVRSNTGVKDNSEAQDASPLESQREWQRQAEDNILSRLERSGLVAPPGELDAVLNTVVNNLIVTNNLAIEPEVRCRVLLTTPLEVFAIGNTIVISRGLLDVLPDESTLAMALASELGQVVLGNSRITKFAFQDLTMFPDQELLKRFRFQHSPAELQAGDARTLEIMAKSPYKDNLGNIGLFLRALSERLRQLPNLVTPRLGDGLVAGGSIRFAELLSKAPPAVDAKKTQVLALPLGGRVKLDAWNDDLKLMKSQALAILSPRDNIPFEVTPFKIHLTHTSSDVRQSQK